MILVGLGANLEFDGFSPVQNMEKVLADLDSHEHVEVEDVSSWYRTAPVGKVDQPDYVNGVARLKTRLEPLDLMSLLLETEKRYGRVRGERWGPRTMDLDLLDFDACVLDTHVVDTHVGDTGEEGITLHLPHPRMHERAFVLAPLLDVAPTWKHPVSGRSGADYLTEIGANQEVQRVDVVGGGGW